MKVKKEVVKWMLPQLKSFHNFEDVVVYLTGYFEDMLIYAQGGSVVDVVFKKSMFDPELIAQLKEYDNLKDMEAAAKEYVRKLLEIVVQKKSKELYDVVRKLAKADIQKFFPEAVKLIGIRKKAGIKNGQTETTLSTEFGVIRYKKYFVRIPLKSGSYRSYAPIEDYLGTLPTIHYPKNILVKVGQYSTHMSYRQVAKVLNDSGIKDITFQTVWNLVRNVIAPKIYDLEKERTIQYLLGKENEVGTEKEKISTLFIEWDGVWLSLNNTKDESMKTGKKSELKLGKSYIGWDKRYGSGENESYETVGTRYVAGFDTPEVLREMLNGKIHEAFDFAGVKQIIVNGDGATWIFQDYDMDSRVILQLDMFHIVQKVHRCIKEPALKKEILKYIEKDKYLDAIEKLRKVIDEKQREENVKALKEVYEYLDNNFGKLRRYQKVAFVKLENGLKARNLGTMEASVRHTIGRRMKIAGWSLEGAKALATMLCLEHEGKLEEVLNIVLDRSYQMKHSGSNLEELIEKYKGKEEKEMEKRGKEANIKILNRGKYEATMNNTDVKLNKILKEHGEIKKYFPKDII